MLDDKYGVRARQNELLVLLKQVDELLTKNGIKYSLSGGSLLGAIRHNGFIPWDDDVDIMVDRSNFEKIRTLCSSDELDGMDFKRLLWIYRFQEKGHNETSLNVPTVDVFVIDNCPNNSIVRKFKILLIKCLQGMMKSEIEYSKHGILLKLCLWSTHILGKLFTDKFKFKIYDKVSRIGNGKSTKRKGCYNDIFRAVSLNYPSTVMDSVIYHTFEDTEMPIIAQYDDYLKIQYGDYMTPPKECDRVPEHT